MIDIHCHMIPGIDDGAKNMEEALEMARIASTDGIKTIVNTSHYFDENPSITGEDLENSLADFNQRLNEEKIALDILLGHEVFISPNIAKLMNKERNFTLHRSRYLLIELPLHHIPIYSETVIYELMLKGIVPVIAHPERYDQVMEDPHILYRMVEMGALVQINGGSILGNFGDRVKKTALLLMDHGLVHFIGSDGHSPRRRKPVLFDAYAYIEGKWGNSIRHELEKNAEKLIRNEKIIVSNPIPYKPAKKYSFMRSSIHFLTMKYFNIDFSKGGDKLL